MPLVEMEIKSAHLFYGDADLSSTEDKLLSVLKIALSEVELEQERIKLNLKRLDDYRKLRREIGKKEAQTRFFKENSYIYEEIMADIHLWLIAWGNIHKTVRRLHGLQNDSRLGKLLDTHKKWFLKTRIARNSIEHLDERAFYSTKLFLSHTDLDFSFVNNAYEIFGLEIKFNALTFKKVDSIIKELDAWYSNLSTVFEKL